MSSAFNGLKEDLPFDIIIFYDALWGVKGHGFSVDTVVKFSPFEKKDI